MDSIKSIVNWYSPSEKPPQSSKHRILFHFISGEYISECYFYNDKWYTHQGDIEMKQPMFWAKAVELVPPMFR